MKDTRHLCSQLEAANNFDSDIDIIIYKVGTNWYYRIDDNEEGREQEVKYCPYCGAKLG